MQQGKYGYYIIVSTAFILRKNRPQNSMNFDGSQKFRIFDVKKCNLEILNNKACRDFVVKTF